MKTILLVEPEESIRTTVAAFLHKAGYDTALAENAETALSLAKKNTFAAAIIECDLPQTNGLELVGRLRARGQDCPVLLTTGAPRMETVSQALELGVSNYLPKPVRRDTLVKELERAMQRDAEKRRNMLELFGAREALEELHYRYHALFESVDNVVTLYAPDGRILDANNVACKELGLDRATLLGMRQQDIETDNEKDLATRLQELREKHRILYETKLLHRKSKPLPALVLASLVKYKGEHAVLAVANELPRV